MNRQDCIWVAIRAFGVYLLIVGMFQLPKLIASIYQVHSYLPLARASAEPTHAQSMDSYLALERVVPLGNAVAGLVQSGLSLILSIAAGVYLLRGGRWLMRVMNHPAWNADDGHKGGAA